MNLTKCYVNMHMLIQTSMIRYLVLCFYCVALQISSLVEVKD